MQLITLQCQVCSKDFQATEYENRTGRKFCSRKCSQENRSKKVTLICQVCSGEFKVSPVYAKRGAKFCSTECRNKSMQIEKVCEICGKSRTVGKRFSNSKYCSQECSHEAQKDKVQRICQQCNKQEYVQRAYALRPFCNKKCMTEWQRQGRIQKACKVCGKEFKVSPSRKEVALYCSQNCAGTANVSKGIKNLKQFTREDIGRFFRSSWEANYARYLNHLGIQWQYEPKTFKLSSGKNYTPDFYLTDKDTYIEIKGHWFEASLKKFKEFRKEFPHIKVVLIDPVEYYKIAESFSFIPNWE